MNYAELHCLSAFSFQRGASTAKELFARAKQIGYHALAVTDECTLAGIVRAWEAAREHQVPLIVGSEIRIEGGPKLVVLVRNLQGYETLSQLITIARRRAPKGEYRSLSSDYVATACRQGLIALWVPDDHASAAQQREHAQWILDTFGDSAWLSVQLHRGPDDATRCARLLELARQMQMPAVASGDAHMHVRARRALQDTLTAIRHHCTLTQAGAYLFPNGERHLRTKQALSNIYPHDLLAETVRVAELCTAFDLGQLRYEYPQELVPANSTPTQWLRTLVLQGARERWPAGIDEQTQQQIEHELAVIAQMRYEPYFLTVHDIVRFARSRQILCQGRGSAANSVVCYALGVTAIDPVRMGMLFERFISAERNEPPDIDIDFEHERREEVLQYVFNRYGRERAALTAVVAHYRGRSAIRDVAKTLGMAPDQVNALASTMDRWGGHAPVDEYLREKGFDPETPLMRRIISLTVELIDFPRHLSQHPGGFVISERPLSTLVPTENAAMDDRTIIQWDKDDLDTMGLLKVDCLALGMLTAIRKTLDCLRRYGECDLDLASVPSECAQTYDMICKADTVGVFQIESRAQMAMLPRLRPRCYYDLVVEVAIVRPGPIVGQMVHPYLRRRQGLEPITYPPALRSVFERTLGVPLFQEQVMQLAILGAGYTPGEADALRRSMAAWKRRGGLEPHRERLLQGFLRNGYTAEYAEGIFTQIQGFGEYGFPESHAASFALLTYVSSWLKCHYPAHFACELINSWPLGFYTPDQVLQDVRRHDVAVLPVDALHSDWDCTIERHEGRAAIRLGWRMVSGFRQEVAETLMAQRSVRAFDSVEDLSLRCGLDARHRALLADAGALRSLAGHRHRAQWAVAGIESSRPLLVSADAQADADVHSVALPAPTISQDLLRDYASTGTTLGPHPLSLVRPALRARRFRSAVELETARHGQLVHVGGLVTVKQRPYTAAGVTFVTLEDETGTINIVIWKDLALQQRRVLAESRLLLVHGRAEQVHGVRHVIAGRLENGDALLGALHAVVADGREYR